VRQKDHLEQSAGNWTMQDGASKYAVRRNVNGAFNVGCFEVINLAFDEVKKIPERTKLFFYFLLTLLFTILLEKEVCQI
jgi:hypothetical protein